MFWTTTDLGSLVVRPQEGAYGVQLTATLHTAADAATTDYIRKSARAMSTDAVLAAISARLPDVEVLARYRAVRDDLTRVEVEHGALDVRAEGLEAQKRDRRLYLEPGPEGIGERLAKLTAQLAAIRQRQAELSQAADQLRLVLAESRAAAKSAIQSLARREVGLALDRVSKAKEHHFRDRATTMTVTEFLTRAVILEEALRQLRAGEGLVEQALAALDEPATATPTPTAQAAA